jgi:hypothetical protein
MGYRIKQYDTKTALKATLNSDGKPVDLREAKEVHFILAHPNKTVMIYKLVNIIDAQYGKVWFPFEESETSQTGNFRGEFVITFLDGRKETWPNSGVIPIEIVASNVALTKL